MGPTYTHVVVHKDTNGVPQATLTHAAGAEKYNTDNVTARVPGLRRQRECELEGVADVCRSLCGCVDDREIVLARPGDCLGNNDFRIFRAISAKIYLVGNQDRGSWGCSDAMRKLYSGRLSAPQVSATRQK